MAIFLSIKVLLEAQKESCVLSILQSCETLKRQTHLTHLTASGEVENVMKKMCLKKQRHCGAYLHSSQENRIWKYFV